MLNGETPGRLRQSRSVLRSHGIDVQLERVGGSGARNIPRVTAPAKS